MRACDTQAIKVFAFSHFAAHMRDVEGRNFVKLIAIKQSATAHGFFCLFMVAERTDTGIFTFTPMLLSCSASPLTQIFQFVDRSKAISVCSGWGTSLPCSC
jgi:hypothetical protein